jgi:3-(3-hydroxy-phenyl)propionate hydroxylase
MDEFDVVICGYGPTGMVAASLLAQSGHKVAVFERWPTLYGQPRMATIDGETARIIQNAADTEQAFKNSVARPRYIQANESGQILIDHDWNREHICGFPFRISLHQPDIEDAMDATARMHGAEINQGWEVSSFTQDPGGVSVTARRREADGSFAGAERTVRAKYLIGSDGARSTVRTSLGIERETWPFRDAWLCLDAVRKRELPNLFGISPDGRVAVIFCVPNGKSHSIIPLGTNHIRFNFRIDPDTPHSGKLDRENAYRLIKDVYGVTEDDVDVYREAIYPFEGKLALSWRIGRVFLAGDAAHLMTPFYGQGGCSGLRDSINLSWKLNLVLRGVATPAILDTYEAERIPHVRVHIDNADKLGAVIFMDDPKAAAERDEIYLSGRAPAPKPEPHITSGVVDLAIGAGVALAGTIGPQGRVRLGGREGRLDDLVGWGFQLVCRNDAVRSNLDAARLEFLQTIGTTVITVEGNGADVVEDIDGVYHAYLSRHGVAFFLSRPDFVIFGASASAVELPAVVDRLRAILQPSPASIAGD